MPSVDAVRHGVSGCVDDVGQDSSSDSCAVVGDGSGKGCGVCQGGGVGDSGRGGVGDGQGGCDATAATSKDGGTDSSRCRGSDGQGVAGYAVSQSVSYIVGPQDVAIRA